MRRAPSRCQKVLYLAVVAAACGGGKPVPSELALRPGLTIHSQLKAGAVRRFSFDLQRDQFVELRVTQEHIDAVLKLHFPGEQRRLVLDTQTSRPVPERLLVVAPRGGRYVLEISGASAKAAGPFRLEVVAVRPASGRDRLAARALEELTRAEELQWLQEDASDDLALPSYARAIALYARLGDTASEAYAQIQRSRVLKRRHRLDEAVAALRRTLALSPATTEPALRARAATDLAKALAELGETTEADAIGREALALWGQLGDELRQAQVLNSLAHLATERGELAQAEGWYREALAAYERNGDSRWVAQILANLAPVYLLAGEDQLALDAAESAWARLPADATPDERAYVLEQRGSALEQLGRDEEAVSALAEALELHRQANPDSPAVAQAERRLARFAYDRERYAEAASRYRTALGLLAAAGDRRKEIATRQDLAWTELKRGHLAEAERLFAAILPEAQRTENRWLEAAALAGRARVERARGRLDPALDLARQALAVVETLRHEAGRTDLQTSVFAAQQIYFELAVALLMERHAATGDPALLTEAFELSERSRARRLLDLLAAPQLSAGAAAARRAAAELNRAEERLRDLHTAGASMSEIELAKRAVREAVLALRRQEGRQPPEADRLGGAPLSLAEIQRRLDRDTVLLEVDLGEEASWLWVVSPRRLAVHRLASERVLEPQVRLALDVLSSRGFESESIRGRQILAETAKLLLGEVLEDLGARRWLVVADGALNALPLGPLPDSRRPGQPLLASYEIVFAPSASVAVRLTERGPRRRRGERELAVFADAVTSASDRRLRGTAAHGVAGRLELPRLRYSGEEATSILSLVPPERRLDAQGFAASKERILAGELEDVRLLHFAVHGLPNGDHPELSSLALSTYDRAGRRRDGILHAHEIAGLHLSADLAVLSACQSGQGAAIAGEGLVGLSHAFLTAGTARVIASYWPVDDRASSVLMSRFYEGLLRRHLSPSRALQEAQLAMLHEDPWRRPYYWGGFVVQGGF